VKWLALIALLVGCAQEREPVCTDCESQGVHPAGYDSRGSENFHGADIERRGWDLALCQSCHENDFSGNAAAPSCMSCHEKRPDSCDTCHENPPTTAAHEPHQTNGVACAECHTVPTSWEAHRKPATRTALVTFGAVATSAGAMPAWDGAKCSNAYCHGGTLGDAAATNTQPVWKGGAAQAACGTCHGKPPASHAQSECATCHSSGKHIDAVVDVATSCNGGCHGDAKSAAPATGAHRAHLEGGYFTQPLACNECHRVPTAVGDAGHLDSLAPAELVFGLLATARGAVASWNGSRCSTYCHGASTPAWAGTGATDAYCGSCHGLPPATSPHLMSMQLTDCVGCHQETVGPFANVLVGNGKHMNGVADAN
jgi:predicted CxxxxCH...CXXCH cytochrome family protein